MSTVAGREYDEMEGMKQLERQIEKLTDVFSKLGEKVKVQQIGQHAKIYAQTQKGLKLDEKHHDLRMRQIDQQKRATIEAFAERQKEIRQTKLLTKAMKQQITTYDKVFRSLGGGGNSIGGGLNMMTGKLTAIAKSSKAMLDAEKAFQKKYKDTGVIDKGLLELLKTAEKTFNQDTFNSKTLKGMAGKLSRLAEFMEENQGKILITAGVASVLIGIIGKALNVAPMFQAMFKLMQLAVNMILMPIGTFIGAMVKPFLVLLIRTLAPAFQEAMKMAMDVGGKIGEILVSPSAFIANGIREYFDPSPIDPTTGLPVERTPVQSNPALDIGIGVGGTVAGLAGIIALTKKVMPRVMSSTMGMFGATNNINGKVMQNAGTGNPLSTLSKGLGGHGTKAGILNLLGKGFKFASKAAIPLMAVDMISDLLSPTAGGEHSDGMTTKREQATQGNALDHIGVMFQDFLGMFGVTNDLDKKIKDPLSPLHDSEDAIAEGTEGLINGMKNVDKLEDLYNKMGYEMVPTMDSQTIQIMNTFIRMKEMTNDSKEAMERTADLFSLAEATVEAKIQRWIKVIPPKKDGTERPEKKDARFALQQYQTASAPSSFMGGRNYVNPWSKANQGTTTTLQDRLEKEAERAKEAFNKANPYTSYDFIYGTKETTPSGHKYPAGFNQSGITRSQMEKQISGGFLGGLGTTSTGAVDYSSILGNYNGGQISEPILGVGRSGRRYSFGEHGAETITPNGQMGGGGGITINIGKIEKNADFEQLKPMIQKWILEANSRRGMI